MFRDQRGRDLENMFSLAPMRSRLLFYAGVFCCFAPVGLLKQVQTLGVAPWSQVAIESAFSGLLAVSWAACAIQFRRWLPAAILVNVVFSIALRRWLPDAVAPTTIAGMALLELKSRMTVIMLATLAVIVLAYVSFLLFILGEGRRSYRAYTEIRLAREIHATLVPAIRGELPAVAWRGVSQPSGEVGGDLVDVVDGVGTDRAWTGCVADVTGHGVAAGVLMGMFKTAVHASLPDAANLGDLLTRVNRTLCPLTQSHMFVTCACLRLLGPRQLEYALAGHPPFLHVSRRTGQAVWIGNQQLAIGLIGDAVFESRMLEVEPGDVLVIVTDGLTEVFDRHDRELGVEGLSRVVVPLVAAGSLEAIESAVFRAAAGHGPQTDDQTVLVMRVAPGPPAPRAA